VGKNLPTSPFELEDFKILQKSTCGIHVPQRSGSCNNFLNFFRPLLVRDGTRTDAQQQLAVVEYVEAAKLNLTKQRIAGRIVDDDTLFFVSVFNSW